MNQGKLPLVTTVIPVYNHEKYVIESIRSVIDQSYPRIELIVINDGSKDQSHDMVLTLVEECEQRFERFEYINRENRGLTATLNQALEMAQGKYFSALASDDIILSDKFSCLVEALESSDDTCAGVFGNASFIGEQGQEIHLDQDGRVQEVRSEKTYSTLLAFNTKESNFNYKTEFGTYWTLLTGCYLPAMSSVLKTAIVKEVGGWTPGNVLEDWEMWLKLSKQYKLLFIDKATAAYRVHGKNSRDTIKQQMEHATLMLLAREREYCSKTGLARAWRDSFYGVFYWLMRYGDASVKEKLQELHYLELSDLLPFVSFLVKVGYKKLSRKMS